MNNTRMLSLMARMSVVVLGCSLMTGGAMAQVPTGEAVVAGKVGEAKARVFTGPVHEGKSSVKDIQEGDSVGETSRFTTGKDGRLCVVLSPGAILCVAPQTEVVFNRLRHSSDGLPQSEQDLVRQIHIDLVKGRVMVHAGTPSPSLDIEVHVDAGIIKANGGTFVVAESGSWSIFSEEHQQDVIPAKGESHTLNKGDVARLTIGPDGKGVLTKQEDMANSPLRQFELCETYFQDLETFYEDPLEFDRAGLNQFVGNPLDSEFIGDFGVVTDVSPSFRPVVGANIQPPVAVTAGGQPGGRWDKRRIWAWYDSVGVIKGVNYVPRNAVNSTEMWMEESFDPDIIDEELGWARNAGYTAVRIQLQYAVWQKDPDGFKQRLEKFAAIADDNELRFVPVLFDDLNLAGADPTVGPQPEPLPGVYNGRWTPSPGSVMVKDRNAWPELERYIKEVMDSLKDDDRVLYWDLYNTAGNGDLWEQTLPLLDQSFNWARAVNAEQPLAVSAWTRFDSAMSARKLERSDIITFQSFDNKPQVEALIMMLKRFDRPIICADWLMRQRENDFENMLPVFSANRIGWFNRGLVKGKTQQWIQQAQYRAPDAPDVWQQDVLQPDGKAYDDKEVEMIQAFRYLESP